MSSFIVDILLDDVLTFHKSLEHSHIPVSAGIRDKGLIESAVNAPFATFGGEELYPSLFDKAAQLLYGLSKNHGFVDGNKRTALHSALMLLLINNIELYYNQEEIVNLAVNTADGSLSPKDISEWFERHTKLL